MSEPKKQPRWTIPFLRALKRAGDVRASAEDAGIDHTTAYLRRRTHPDFAIDWEEALKVHAERVEREREEELQSFDKLRMSGVQPSSQADLVGGGSLMKRAGHDRWSQAKEKLFFDELAATANVKRSAKAAGVSPNAVYARRMKQPLFRAKWDAVLETGRASIEMHLVEAANRSLDPDELDVGSVEPKVSVAEAIRITQGAGSRKAQEEPLSNPFAERVAGITESGVEELRERILGKVRRLTDRFRAEKLAEGWMLDEAYDQLVPPGWVKAVL